jgi:5-methylcytosine-specific restriction endonuclease McrA
MNSPSILQRPIVGGPFGVGRYALATMPIVSRGLHAVRHMVIDPRAGAVLSISEDKREALALARRVLSASSIVPAWEQRALWMPTELPAAELPRVRSVSRRRREIFDRSQGRCFYCGQALQLAGPWHIEHSIPKAMDGSDARLNLVAACVRCNLAKSDSSALEFLVASLCLTKTA